MKKFKVDARGLDCPKPLLRTKEALANEEFDQLEVLVSNAAAKENVTRFLNHSGFNSVEWEELGKDYLIQAVSSEKSSVLSEDEPKVQPLEKQKESPGNKTVLIASTRIGMGKKDLGRLLMKGYIYTLTQMEIPPACLVFMNTGVKLTMDDSESLDDLRTLQEKGVNILVCGTCLEFMELKDRLAVGQISNMYEIAEKLHVPEGVITFT